MWRSLLLTVGRVVLALVLALTFLLAGLAAGRMWPGIVLLPLAAVLFTTGAARLPSARRGLRFLLGGLAAVALAGAALVVRVGWRAEMHALLTDPYIGPNGLDDAHWLLWAVLLAGLGATLVGGIAGVISRQLWFAAACFSASLFLVGLVAGAAGLLGNDLTYDMDRRAFVGVPTDTIAGGVLAILLLSGAAMALSRHRSEQGREERHA